MEPNQNIATTLEVVNQYYRAPKLFYWLQPIQTSDRNVGSIVCVYVAVGKEGAVWGPKAIATAGDGDVYRPVG